MIVAVVDLDTGDRTASIIGAVLAAVGLVVSVLALARQSRGDSSSGRRVQAERGVAAGGNVANNAIGRNSRVDGSASPAASPGATTGDSGAVDVQAGPGGVAAGGDIAGNAIGDDSQVR
ncbi:hypothetical protein [Streptomyces sp. H34-S4]|uniref:hypothetical protein n=1 Tax=Streptomyces sp. H34-S4 TaxID=2996463 RepID=UPI0022721777|nr:hypothetical protein [Streptomyces sp. H34-S4]MCY0933059.1 hypothetical protein [Streptomyces sp. H34-S4]